MAGLTARVSFTGPLFATGATLAAIGRTVDAMLLRVGLFGHKRVQTRTPVGWHGAATGLRGSIFHELIGTPIRRGVLITHGKDYGDVVEVGRRPGRRPPIVPITLWVRGKLGVTDPKASRALAFYVQKKIALRGYAGHRMFARSFPAIKAEFQREAATLTADVAKILNGAP